MKEITRIHLASVPFSVEAEVVKQLAEYVQAITKVLNTDKEAMREIELRMVELLDERGVKAESVITADDFEAIKKQLGDPKDFTSEDFEESGEIRERPKKQLMRDLKNAKIGGVFAGLASYLNVDVSFVRIAGLALVFLTAGAMIPIYLATWLIIPVARTASDRLLMSGQAVNLSTLKEESESEPGKTTVFARFVRVVFTIGFALASFASLMAVLVANFITYRYSAYGQQLSYSFMILMSIAGISLAILFCVIAYILIKKVFSNKILVLIIGTIIIGVISSSSAVLLERTNHNRSYQTEMIEKRLDETAKLSGLRNLVIDADELQVNYIVSEDYKVVATYNQAVEILSNLNFVREGDTLSITGNKINNDEISRRWGVYTIYLTIHGPSLDFIRLNNRSYVNYDGAKQASLQIDASNGSSVNLGSTIEIDKLSAKIKTGADLNATEASIKSVSLNVQSLESATFGTINDINLVSSQSCGVGNFSRVSAESVRDAVLNGVKIDEPEKRIECLEYNFNYNFYY